VSVARYQGVEWIEAEVTLLHGGMSAVRGSGKEPMDKEPAVAPQPIAA
jgi:hypothetical protein